MIFMTNVLRKFEPFKFFIDGFEEFLKSSFLRNESFNMFYFCCPCLLFYGKTLKILTKFYKFCKLNFKRI